MRYISRLEDVIELDDVIESIWDEIYHIEDRDIDLPDHVAIRRLLALQTKMFCKFTQAWIEVSSANIRSREKWEEVNSRCDEDEEYEDEDEEDEDSLEITDVKLNGHPYEIIEFYSDDSGNEVKLPFDACSLEFSVNINGVRYYGRMREYDP